MIYEALHWKASNFKIVLPVTTGYENSKYPPTANGVVLLYW
jgi:hypothetical protein